MDQDRKYGEEIAKLDLAKYGLAELEGRNLLDLNAAEMDRLLLALGNDEISLNVPIPCTAENVQGLLAVSNCRRCGGCCKPNPKNPGSPGVEVFEEELRAMADHLHTSYDSLKAKTSFGQVTSHAFDVINLGFTRWLPLPCPFYNEEQQGCVAHPVRGDVCKVYPVVFNGDNTYTSIRVTCDYGKDVLIAACKRLCETSPGLAITL